MKPTKYIVILFISIFLGKCFTPLAQSIARLDISDKSMHLLLIAVMYLLLLAGDFILSRISYATSGENWLEVYERPLNSGERLFGLDVIRFFAVISVPAVHSLGLTGFYDTPLEGGAMFAATCLRWLFICCVPIFLTLTGFLKCGKGIEASHYKSIFAVLATHIFITCIRLLVDHKIHGVELTADYIITKLVYFEYGWYIKLYIGIMLLVPFFNLIWSSLEERFHKELCILTLIFLCSLGPLTADIIPSSWLILYVFAFYFMGAYLKDYEVCINKGLNLMLILLLLVVTAVGSFAFPTESGLFDWKFAAYSTNSGYSSLPVVILTFLIMTLLMDVDTEIAPIRWLFYSVSVVSLEMYMFSQMFDGIIYPKLSYEGFVEILPSIPLVVGEVIILSYIASHIKRIVFTVFSIPLGILHKN